MGLLQRRCILQATLGMKAFVVTGVGDVFLLGAIFIIFNYAGTLNFVELIKTAPSWLASCL